MAEGSEVAGVVGGVLGAGGGIAASTTAIAAGGTVVGTSAAGIASGLAAMGSFVGGGMLAGVAVAAVPALCGAYLGYKVFKKIFS